MLTPCSTDFPYAALSIVTSQPPGTPPCFPLISIDPNGKLHCLDLVFSVSSFPSPVFRLCKISKCYSALRAVNISAQRSCVFRLCKISKCSSALRALHILSGSGFPKHGNFLYTAKHANTNTTIHVHTVKTKRC